MEIESSTKSKTCYRCKEVLPIYHFRLLENDQRYSYCKPCEVGTTNLWKEINFKRHSENYVNYFANETGFITASIASKYKPSFTDQIRKDVLMETHKEGVKKPRAYTPEMSKQEMWVELILHIQFMKDRHPESDGRLCRICEQPWTYLRNKPTKVNSGQSGGKTRRKRFPKNFSIDRYDNSQTYKIGNIIFVCGECNSKKNASEKWMWKRLLEIEKELDES